MNHNELMEMLNQILDEDIPLEDVQLMDKVAKLRDEYKRGDREFILCLMSALFAFAHEHLSQTEKQQFGEDLVKGLFAFGLKNKLIQDAPMKEKKIPSC